MKTTIYIYRGSTCAYCRKPIYSMNMGSSSQPMCERCWERGGDDY